jgi:tetratricopeptide (TPR) repeat protein
MGAESTWPRDRPAGDRKGDMENSVIWMSVIVATLTMQPDAIVTRCMNAPDSEANKVCAAAFQWAVDTGGALPESELLYTRLIAGAHSLGDLEGAKRLSREAMRRFPWRYEFAAQLGAILLDSQDAPFEAYGPLLEAARLKPRDGQVQRRLGEVLFRMGRLDEALTKFTLAESLAGPNWETVIGRAQTLRALSREREALQALELAKRWEREHLLGPLSMRMRVELLIELGQIPEAVRELNAMLASDALQRDETIWARCELARALKRLGRTAEATRACHDAAAAAGNTRATPCGCTP